MKYVCIEMVMYENGYTRTYYIVNKRINHSLLDKMHFLCKTQFTYTYI